MAIAQRLNFLHCVLVKCKCKKHEVCSEGKCICKIGFKKDKKGHCVGQNGKSCMFIVKTKNEIV